MARPTETVCLRSNFATANPCYKVLTPHERRALAVYFMVQELAALGGTDYLAELGPDGTLNTAATAYKTMNLVERQVARLVILADNVDSAGATPPATKVQMADAIKCLKNFTVDDLDRMELLLMCLLGRHAAMPQVDL